MFIPPEGPNYTAEFLSKLSLSTADYTDLYVNKALVSLYDTTYTISQKIRFKRPSAFEKWNTENKEVWSAHITDQLKKCEREFKEIPSQVRRDPVRYLLKNTL